MSDSANAETEVFPALNVPPQPSASRASAHAGAAHTRAVGKASHKRLYIVLASVLGGLVLLAGLAYGFGHFFFADRAPLGTSFAGQSVAGKTEEELTQLVQAKATNTKFSLSTSEGKAITADYSDLGVTVNVKETVKALLDARGTNAFAKVNPFAGPTVAAKTTTDTAAMQAYLIENLVSADDQVVLPTVSYDAAGNTFVASEGEAGKVTSATRVAKAVTASYTQPATTSQVTVELTTKESPISQETAQKAATEATERLARKLVVTNGSKKTFTVPAAKIGEWTTVTPDTDKGTLTVGYDEAAIKTYLEQTLPTELKQEKVDQENLTKPNGTRLMVKVAGVDGIDVSNTADAITQVTAGLQNNTDVSAQVGTDVVKFETKDTQVPSNFSVANGDPWVQINLSTQTVTAYKGTTVVKSFNTSTGKATAGRQSDNGTFYVYLKYRTQTMRGDGYVSPNVQWVSYYNGGEGFHAAPWNLANIGKGLASSHGCINMVPSEAKWIYDFAPIGTKVEVIGTTSAASVR